MSMNRVAVLGLAALSVAQVGCGRDPCTVARPNGLRGELNFGVPLDAAQGMQTQVSLLRFPQVMFENPFTFANRDPSTCFFVDSDEIQVDLPASLQSPPVVIERPAGQDPGIRFTCNAPAGEPQRVTVRVVSEGTVLREDEFDISCHPIETAGATPMSRARPMSGDGYVVGGLLHVMLELEGSTGRDLSGFGALPADSLLIRELNPPVFDPMMETYKVAGSGQSPTLQVASHVVQLPVTLVPDDAWTLQIETSSTSTSKLFSFNAWPKTADGMKLNGLETCKWTAFTATDSEVLADTTCDLQHFNTLPGTNRFVTKMCVEALGRSACVPMPS